MSWSEMLECRKLATNVSCPIMFTSGRERASWIDLQELSIIQVTWSDSRVGFLVQVGQNHESEAKAPSAPKKKGTTKLKQEDI